MKEKLKGILSIAEKIERRKDHGAVWFQVKASQLYPMMIQRMKEALNEKKLPEELIGSSNPDITPSAAARKFMNELKELVNNFSGDTKEMANCALVPFDRCFDLKPSTRDLRNKALELARRWFTRALKLKVNKLGLHIVDDCNKIFKLC